MSKNIFELEMYKLGKLYSSKKSEAAVNKDEFLSVDLVPLKNSRPSKFTEVLYEYYKTLAFFPDEQILSKFKEFGFNQNELKWFIPIDTILAEMKKVNQQDILVMPYTALHLIIDYVRIKIAHTVLSWSNREFGTQNLNKFQNQYKNLERQSKYVRKSYEKYEHRKQTTLKKIYQKANEKSNDSIYLRKFLRKAHKGNIDETYISLLLECGFCPKQIKTGSKEEEVKNKEMSENEFLWRLSNLLIMIMKDRHFFTDIDAQGKVRKESDGYRLDTVRSLKKICKNSFSFKASRALDKYFYYP